MYRWALLVSCFWASWLPGQSVTFFQNPSFEDTPRHSHPPHGWNDEGFEKFLPGDTYDYIYLEAYYYYGDGEALPYNGNLLVDHCSPIVPCSIAEAGEDLYQYQK